MAEAAAQTDRDLTSIAEARALARRAKQAWLELAELSQEKIDAVVDAMAAAATPQAEAFARLFFRQRVDHPISLARCYNHSPVSKIAKVLRDFHL